MLQKTLFAKLKMYGGVGPEVRFGQRKDSDWVSLYLRTDNRRVDIATH